jgi:hypothetical protein
VNAGFDAKLESREGNKVEKEGIIYTFPPIKHQLVLFYKFTAKYLD